MLTQPPTKETYLKFLAGYLARIFVIWNLEKYQHNPFDAISAGNYMFKVNNRNTRTRCEICSKLIFANSIYKTGFASCAWIDVSDFKHRGVEMFLLKF